MRKLVGKQLDESKSAAEHLPLFTSILSQLQDSGLPPFDDKLKAIFLLMTLPDSWETLVVSMSNNPNLTFDGVRGSILNEEIGRKASGEGGSSANMVRGRTEKRNAYAQKSKSKSKERGNASKGKDDVTCYQFQECRSKLDGSKSTARDNLAVANKLWSWLMERPEG
ncbi:hypothetical protein L7F22_026706 [Adiantum nelumboides]|nr:hypothetical protein [Adiantum nelumboides]